MEVCSLIIRVQKNEHNPYAVIDKTALNDKRLSFKAKGIISYLLSKPDNWKPVLSELSNSAIDGETSVRSGLKELIAYKYMVRQSIKENGKIVAWEHVIYEKPQDIKQAPQVDFPQVENPQVENRTLISNDIKNNDLISNKEDYYIEIYKKIVTLYHTLCVSLPRLKKVTDGRKKAMKMLLKKKYSTDTIEIAFKKVEESDFLSGRNGKWTSCNFDWIINEDNIVKILEGKYDKKISAEEIKQKQDQDKYVTNERLLYGLPRAGGNW